MFASELLIQIASSCDKQLYLRGLIGTLDWKFDLTSGVLSFGTKYSWHAQVLGVESEPADTWHWTWAYAVTYIPHHLLEASCRMKEFGEQHGIPELARSRIPLGQVDGHMLSLFASNICRANAYYRCPHDGGALFILIKDEKFPQCSEPSLTRIASIFPQVISLLVIPDHRLAFTSYLDYYSLGYERDGRRIVVKDANGSALTATFDEYKRLTNLEFEPCESEPEPEPIESWDIAQIRRMLRA